MSCFLGIDAGTSGIKAIVLEDTGKILGVGYAECNLITPRPAWVEENPLEWWEACDTAVKQAVAKSGKGMDIVGIGFSGQMQGSTLMDKDMKPIGNCMIWMDQRAADIAAELNTRMSAEEILATTGSFCLPTYWAPKLLWLRANEPESFVRIRKVMLPKDYLAYCFTGVHCTDVSDASGMLTFDVVNKLWSPEMLDICGLTRGQMAGIYESSEVVGTLRSAMAAETGLSESVKVIAGAGDNAAAAVGTGVVGQGGCNISLGTSGTIFLSSSRPLQDPNHALHTFAHADGGYHLLACMLSAASCNKWWMEDILGDGDYAAEQAKMDALGTNPVFFLPYLMGERSPHNDPTARAAFVGMSMDTPRHRMTQAVMEGVLFGLRDSLEVARSQGLTVTASNICGGGARSPLWRAMAANILDLEIRVPAVDEGPALGSAMLAAVGCGEYASVAEAARTLCRTADVILPDPALRERYQERYGIFRRIYPALRETFRTIVR